MISKINERIYLIGMMGSGKTTVAERLANSLNRSWVDTDMLIEDLNKSSISQIFEDSGEEKFRLLEKETLRNLKGNYLIVSCGGGMPCFNNNIGYMKTTGCVIYLNCDIETLAKRVEENQARPLVKNMNAFEKNNAIKALLNVRIAYYLKSDLVIDANRPISLILNDLELLISTFV